MDGDYGSKPQKLSFQYLNDITKNFSRVLGKGGFATVYEGVQPNGEIVAVKKLLNPMSQKQFENEVNLLMRLEHPNIVRLVGYCYEIQNEHFSLNGKCIFAGEIESLLCMEYLQKGSLDRFLSDPDKSSQLDWHTRYKIIEGTCNGLQYLHEQTDGPIIHLDLKPANILLNDALEPRLADFGLSRLLDQQGTVCTMEVSGTLGYMPPEYLQGMLGAMSDIFSLGVIILEVVTGERKYPENIPPLEEFIETELEKWRDTLQKAPGYTSLEIDCLQIRRCIQIGLKCMNPSRAKRPTITKVIKMLQGLEGMDCNVSNEVAPMAAQIRSGPRELLDIYPSELSFSLDSDEQIRCLVKLTNKTNECVAFHFKVMRSTNNYCIQPAGEFLWPQATTYVVVTMEERLGLLTSDRQCNDEFLVQSIVVREDRVTSKHIPEQTFDKMSSSVVHKVKLPVICIPTVQETSDPRQSEGSQVKLPGRPELSANKKLPQLNQDQEALVECLRKDLGYFAGKPVAAVLVYKCSIQWRTFEVERTSIFDCLIQLIGSALKDQDNNETVAYWLSNSSTLLLLMKRIIKPSAAAPPRIFKSIRASPQSQGGVLKETGASVHSSIFGSLKLKNNPQQVIEVRYPALLFKQQLTAYLEKTYGMIRDNLKREISPILGLCIQAPRTSRGKKARQTGGASVANVLAQLIDHWQSIVKILTDYLSLLKSNHVPSFLICKLFAQIFSFINIQFFNSILLRRECCSFSNGEYVKAGLTELEQWSIDATEEYAGCSWEELKHIRQAVEFLALIEKPEKTLEEITNDLCPVLSVQQIYRISTMYWDDKFGTQSVSSEVISGLRIIMTEDSNNAVSGSFLLDDDSSIPFSLDDILKSAPEFEVTDVHMPPLVREYPCFNFLHETEDKLDGLTLQS